MATLSFFALVLLYAGTFGVAAFRARAAESAYPPSGEFLEVDGSRIHYVEKGEGPPVILIHGANGSLRDFTFDLMDRLAERYRVIAFDRPGLGHSGHLSGYGGTFDAHAESPQEQAAHLAEAARILAAERPIVVGHSYGGIVALAWALDHDAAAVVSLAGVANPWPGDLGPVYRWNGNSLGGAFITPMVSAWAPKGVLRDSFASVFAPQSSPEGYAEHFGLYMPIRLSAFRANARQVNTLRPHVVKMHARYDSLSLPIEIIHGTEDETVPIDIHSAPLAERVASANLTVLEGVGHMPHHADPEATVAAIDRAAARAGLR